MHYFSNNQKKKIISYEDCIRAETQGKKFIEIGGQLEKISEIVVDMTGFNQIPLQNLTLDEQLAEVELYFFVWLCKYSHNNRVALELYLKVV